MVDKVSNSGQNGTVVKLHRKDPVLVVLIRTAATTTGRVDKVDLKDLLLVVSTRTPTMGKMDHKDKDRVLVVSIRATVGKADRRDHQSRLPSHQKRRPTITVLRSAKPLAAANRPSNQ